MRKSERHDVKLFIFVGYYINYLETAKNCILAWKCAKRIREHSKVGFYVKLMDKHDHVISFSIITEKNSVLTLNTNRQTGEGNLRKLN